MNIHDIYYTQLRIEIFCGPGVMGGETGSRNMAATQKINFLTLVSYSLLQAVFS